MANLYDVLADAQHGEAIADLGRQFGLSQQQTHAAVAALLPAISLGLKRSTATPEGLGNLFALMGSQPDIYAMYEDPQAAFSTRGRAAGNAALSKMFGSPEASRAIADQAQQLSGVSSTILKKLLPVLAGILISGLMRSGSGKAAPAPSAPEPAPDQGGGILGDILRQIFKQGMPDSSGPASSRPSTPASPRKEGGSIGDKIGPGAGYQLPESGGGSSQLPTDPGGQAVPGGDILAQIMRELAKAIQEGRLKPVVVGPVEIDIPGQAGPSGSGQTQAPGSDIFGQILREILGGKGAKAQPAHLTQGMGSAVFGDRLETGRSVEQAQLDSLQEVFDRFGMLQR